MLGRAESTSLVMNRCIKRHMRWQAATARLSLAHTRSESRTIRAFAGLSLVAARCLEGFARQRLVDLKPSDAQEAEQKVLYVIAATVTGRMELRLDQIATIGKSVAALKPELRELLQTRKR